MTGTRGSIAAHLIGREHDAKESVLTCKIEALEGKCDWVVPASDNPRLMDVAASGHALASFDGERDKTGRCIGCGKPTRLAWHVAPVGVTVPACNGECVTDRVDQIWHSAGYNMTLRRRGALAEVYATGVLCVPEVVL